jgi:hypothetical protein
MFAIAPKTPQHIQMDAFSKVKGFEPLYGKYCERSGGLPVSL